tara:strand:- start:110 stop:1222 length:1113 start_codon:yes stop_codon:yes gene_type:complete
MSKNNKEKVKVFVFTGSQVSGIVAHLETGKDDKNNTEGYYKGYTWDLFQKMKKLKYLKNYEFDITFSEFGFTNYGQIIDEIEEGKYDFAIGQFISSIEREKKINFTSPTLIDSNAIFHLKEEGTEKISRSFQKGWEAVGQQILLIIIIGIVIGFILFLGNPNRQKTHENLKTKGQFFFRSILTGIASVFGEMGFVSEQATPNIKGLFISFITMLAAFLFLLIIQAQLAAALTADSVKGQITKYTLGDKLILAHNGYTVAKKIEDDGALVKFLSNKTNKELMELYLKNSKKYAGVALSYCDGFPFTKIYPDMTVSLGFGNELSGMPVNKKNIKLLEDLDRSIATLRNTRELQDLCKKYFGDVEDVPTCSLR